MNVTHKIAGCALLFLVAGCGGNTVKEALGIDQRAPDEFRVVSRPALSVPPQFDLRPPGEGESPTEVEARSKAQSLVLGNPKDKKQSSGKSTAEQVFLKKAGSDAADPSIKQKLTEKKIEEQTEIEESGWFGRITSSPTSKEPIVKAEEEAGRIKKNKEEGKAANDGEVKQTSGGIISTLEHWFGGE